MKISIIAAVAENGVIGKDNKLPWKLSDDLKSFKKLTTGHTVIMGRKTYESIGKPLPGRVNIVLTRNKDYEAEDVIVAGSFQEALEFAKNFQEDELFVIGGELVFKKALEYADRMYITEVKTKVNGDAHFPEFDKNEWGEIQRKAFQKDDSNEFAFDFVVYERKQ